MPCITNYVKYLLHSQENLLKDYQKGPWFEGVYFCKNITGKIPAKLPKTA
jgi:hypothetical protein